MPTIRIILAILSLCCGIGVHATEADPFRNGVQAFRAGDYERAVIEFEAAERAGRSDARLQFNLGSTYFKLGRLNEARARFLRIAHDPDWRALAHYNLGLIDAREGRTDAAREHYRSVLAVSDSENLRALAARQLGAADESTAGDSDGGWLGLLSLGGGYDDNVTLTEDPSIVGVSDQKDEFVQVVAGVSRYVTGTYDSGLRLDFRGFGEFFLDLDEFNVASVGTGLTWSQRAGDWYVETGAAGEVQTVGDDAFTRTGTFGIRASHPLGSGLRLRLRGEGSWVNGVSEYDYLTGWRARTGAELVAGRDTGRVTLGYLFEINDRDDFVSADEILSYSPRRNTAYLRLEQPIGRALLFGAGAEYRDGSYDDTDRRVEADGSTTVAERDDSRWNLNARLAWQMGGELNLFADYSYADADSNFEEYRYRQNRFMLGIEKGL